MSCLSWRSTFHGSWENKSKFQMGGLRETGSLPLFSPEGAVVLAVGKPCALRGGCGCCGSLQTMPQHLRVPLSSSAQVSVVSKTETTETCLRKPATGSFAAGMGASLGWGAPIFFL